MKTEQKAEKKNKFKSYIIGSWQMCKSTGGDGETSYNVCPIIVFSEDGIGNIKFFQKKHCNFQYFLKNDMILFSFKSSNDKEAFFATGTEFNFKFHIKNNIETLELSQLKTDYKFILSRIIR
jgi:hypothetical protein